MTKRMTVAALLAATTLVPGLVPDAAFASTTEPVGGQAREGGGPGRPEGERRGPDRGQGGGGRPAQSQPQAQPAPQPPAPQPSAPPVAQAGARPEGRGPGGGQPGYRGPGGYRGERGGYPGRPGFDGQRGGSPLEATPRGQDARSYPSGGQRFDAQRFGQGGGQPYQSPGVGGRPYRGAPVRQGFMPGGQSRDVARDRGGYADRRDGFRDRRGFESRAAWNNGWRQDRRYDWSGYRRGHERLFGLPRYVSPYGRGYGYRRFQVGVALDAAFFGRDYWIDDPWVYRLPPAYGDLRWVRYYNDALLVDLEGGEVVDTVYGIFY